MNVAKVPEPGFKKMFKSSLSYLLLLGSLVISLPSLAEGQFKYSGFASLGLSYESEDDLALFRDNSQNKRPDNDLSLSPDSQLGLQLSYQFDPQWHVTTQFVYADKTDYDLDSAAEWAFVGYSPLPDLDLRAGRVGVDMFQLSDLRRVDYVSPWVRPPTELYGWIIPYSIDGFDISKRFEIASIYWRAKVQYGSTSPTIESPDGSMQFETELNEFIVATLTAEYEAWTARVSYAHFKTAGMSGSQKGFVGALRGIGAIPGPVGSEANAMADQIEDSYRDGVHYTEAALNYDNGTWLVNFELARLKSDSVLLPTGNAGYLSLGRRIGSFTPYAVYSNFQPDDDLFKSTADWTAVPGIIGLRNAALGFINGPFIDQYTHSLGLRWDAHQRLALKAQWDRSHVKANAYGLWAFDSNRQDRDSDIDVFTLSLNYIF